MFSTTGAKRFPESDRAHTTYINENFAIAA
jgi:hypothetical protein